MATVNYNDKRFAKVEADKQTAVNNANKTYDNMINQTDAKYNELIGATKDYATTQQQIQQENTDFAIEKIEQQKDKAERDYTKEQTGAYVDYQKATDQYGVGAERLAQNGMSNTGYSESSQINAFTTYQNRYATARESYNQAVLSYDNAIKEAQLANNAQLAEIAFNSLKTQLEYSLQGFQYKNQLLQTKLDTQIKLDSEYNNRYQQVLSQINTENALAEQIRQYNESMAFQKQQAAQEQANWQKQYNATYGSAKLSSGGGSSSSGGSSKLSGGSSSKSSSSSSKLSDSSSKYGYFSNGYQPKGVKVGGKEYEVKESGLKVYNVFNEGTSSKTATAFGKQNIWTAGGRYFVWDGSIKDYVDVTSKVKTSQSKRVNFDWGR
jgi:hypothetical protein